MNLRQLMSELSDVAAMCGVDLPVVIGVPTEDGKLMGFHDLKVAVARESPTSPAVNVTIYEPPMIGELEPEGEA